MEKRPEQKQKRPKLRIVTVALDKIQFMICICIYNCRISRLILVIPPSLTGHISCAGLCVAFLWSLCWKRQTRSDGDLLMTRFADMYVMRWRVKRSVKRSLPSVCVGNNTSSMIIMFDQLWTVLNVILRYCWWWCGWWWWWWWWSCICIEDKPPQAEVNRLGNFTWFSVSYASHRRSRMRWSWWIYKDIEVMRSVTGSIVRSRNFHLIVIPRIPVSRNQSFRRTRLMIDFMTVGLFHYTYFIERKYYTFYQLY